MADTERPHSPATSLSQGDAQGSDVARTPADRGREGTARARAAGIDLATDTAAILDAMSRVLRSACPPLDGARHPGPPQRPAPTIAHLGPEPAGALGTGVPDALHAAGAWLLDAAHGSATDAPPESSTAAATRTGSRHRAGPRGGDHDEAETARMMALVDLAKQGDAEAFGQLYDHYVSTIYRYIYYRVGTYALAEDLTSETFLRALRALASFKWQGRDFGAWLVTIARNLVADHYKSGRFRLEVATGEILDHDSVSDGPEDDVLASITNETLMQALRELGSDQQECLVLRFLNGLSVAETALALGKSEGAVKQLQLRAIRNLAKQLPDGFR